MHLSTRVETAGPNCLLKAPPPSRTTVLTFRPFFSRPQEPDYGLQADGVPPAPAAGAALALVLQPDQRKLQAQRQVKMIAPSKHYQLI